MIIRARGGFQTKGYDDLTVTKAIYAAAGVAWDKEIQIMKNARQDILIFYTRSTETRHKLLRMYQLHVRGQKYDAVTHLAVPDDFARGVIHGINLTASVTEIKEGIQLHETNPEIIEVKRIGNSQTVVITFAQPEVPRQIRYGDVTFLYYL